MQWRKKQTSCALLAQVGRSLIRHSLIFLSKHFSHFYEPQRFLYLNIWLHVYVNICKKKKILKLYLFDLWSSLVWFHFQCLQSSHRVLCLFFYLYSHIYSHLLWHFCLIFVELLLLFWIFFVYLFFRHNE